MSKKVVTVTQEEYKRYTNKNWIKLNDAVKKYSNANDLEKSELQSLRDDISLARFYLSDVYSELRVAAEAADYHRKQAVSTEALKKPKGTSQSAWDHQSRVNTKQEEETMLEANKKFYRIKLVMETSHHILNSISSRLSSFEKEI